MKSECSQNTSALSELRERCARPYDASTAEGMAEAIKAIAAISGYRTSLEKTRAETNDQGLWCWTQMIDAEAKAITAELRAIEAPIRAVVEAEIRAIPDRLRQLELMVLLGMMAPYDAILNAYNLGMNDALAKAA